MNGEMLYLFTPRLVLRDHVPEDFLEHHALFSDLTAMRFLPELYSDGKEKSKENLRRAIEAMRETPRERFFLKIVDQQTGRHIGEVGYTIVARTPGGNIANLGYFLRPEMWGKGYASEAAAALIDYAFTKGGIWRIETGCLAENRASEGVMRKCKMIREGELKQAVWHEGQWKTRLIYRLLRSEWEAQHEKIEHK